LKKILFISLFLTLVAYGQQQRIAILGTEDDGEPPIKILEQTHLTDKLREIASNILPKTRYGVMTQQSIVDRLGSQEQAARICREATCLADLGRKVNADYIAQARIGRFGGNLTIKTELYNVGSGNLIASFTGDSKDAKGLLSVLEAKAPALFRNMPGVSSAANAAFAGGIVVEESNVAYAQNFQKRYLVNLSTVPEGASLSFNGMPVASCNKTPCKAELPESEVRIIAALEHYEAADTSVSIIGNNQSINIMLKSSFGILDIRPAYSDGAGAREGWSLAMNGKAYNYFENRLSPGAYDVKLSNACYEDVNFKVVINNGSHEIFDMAKHIQLRQGILDLSAEQDGKPVIEPVFANGKRIGETPFSGYVPICSKVEIGNGREAALVELKYMEKVNYTHKMVGTDNDTTWAFMEKLREKQRVIDSINNSALEEQRVSREGVRFGIRAGLNAYDFSFGYREADEGMSMGMGLGAGLALKVPLARLLNLNVGLDFYYRSFFSREIVESDGEFESIYEFAISIPILLQFMPIERSSFYLAAGVQLDFPFGTEWEFYYDYVTNHRAGVDFGVALGFGYMIAPSFGVDFRCVIGLTGLFEDFEDANISYDGSNIYKDRSELRQYGFGVVYFF
jgi:hypothetical protein